MQYFAKSRLIGFSYALILSLTAATIAYADDDTNLAKSKFLEGVTLFSSEDYSGALDAFNDSYRLSPKNATLFNIAMCYKALYRYADSIHAFSRFLETVIREKHPEKVQRAETALLELEALTARLIFLDPPIDATITVDDKPVGKAPLDGPLILDPGQYQIEVSKDGFETLLTAVTLDSGSTVRLPATLISKPGTRNVLATEIDQVSSDLTNASSPEKEATEDTSTLFVLSLVSGGIGIVTLGVGGYFSYQREVTDINDAIVAKNLSDYEKIIERSEDHEAAMAVCYPVGGLLLIAGVVLFIIDKTNHQSDSFGSVLNQDGLTLQF